jgi:Holliday junction DNA helicase RuvB
VVSRLSFYNPRELEHILERAAKKLAIPLDAASKKELAKRSRGTPRIALRLLKRVRDVAQVEGEGRITREILTRSLSMLEIDEAGLDSSDRRLLTVIIDSFGGGPVGIETIAAAISEDVGTVEEVLEPYLMQVGLLKRTLRGRMATPQAYTHLGKKTAKKSTKRRKSSKKS